MTRQRLQQVVVRTLTRIAPEIHPAEIKPDVSLRDQLDLDSVDFLNFVIALHEEVGIDIPEVDYPKLSTLEACIAYLGSRLHSRQARERD